MKINKYSRKEETFYVLTKLVRFNFRYDLGIALLKNSKRKIKKKTLNFSKK